MHCTGDPGAANLKMHVCWGKFMMLDWIVYLYVLIPFITGSKCRLRIDNFAVYWFYWNAYISSISMLISHWGLGIDKWGSFTYCAAVKLVSTCNLHPVYELFTSSSASPINGQMELSVTRPSLRWCHTLSCTTYRPTQCPQQIKFEFLEVQLNIISLSSL